MKVVFWAADKTVSAAANMHILADMLSLLQPCRCVRLKAEIPHHYWKRENRGFLFIDCANCRDKNTKEVLRRADLLIVNVSSDTDFNSFLLWDIHISKNIFFLISNYIGPAADIRERLERVYRINQRQIGIIPYNSEFELASSSGGLKRFVRENTQQARTEKNRAFFYELEIVKRQLLMELEKKQG